MTQKNIQESIKKVKNFQADFGGTELLQPVADILEKCNGSKLPSKIFILTDGAISDEEKFIDYIRTHKKSSRIFSVGIGTGFSKSLIDKIAVVGNGAKAYCFNEADIASSCVTLIQNSFKDFYEIYDFSYDNSIIRWTNVQEDITNSVIPAVISVPENEELAINCLLDPKVLGKKSIIIEFTCKHHKPAQGTVKLKHEKLVVSLQDQNIVLTKVLHHFTANQILNHSPIPTLVSR